MFCNIKKEYPNNIIGLRYFNVYGPGELYKGKMSSMIYQLALQMKAGKNPRIFKKGEQKRDFVYVKDIIQANIKAALSGKSGIYNVGCGKARTFNDIISILNTKKYWVFTIERNLLFLLVMNFKLVLLNLLKYMLPKNAN